jgi:hypothetical protein
MGLDLLLIPAFLSYYMIIVGLYIKWYSLYEWDLHNVKASQTKDWRQFIHFDPFIL